MNNRAAESCPAKIHKIPHFVSNNGATYHARKALTKQQIIKAAKALLNEQFKPGADISCSDDMKAWLQIHYQDLESEVFACIFLDTQHRIIAHEIIFFGTLDQASIFPREVAKRALQLNAHAVIFAHNHPSGSINPSTADRNITAKLKAALGLLDIRALDHFILGKAGVFSFAEHQFI